MNVKLHTYKLLFHFLDLLSNSKWFHKLVINPKIYLGASIISLSLMGNSCSSYKVEPKKTEDKKDSIIDNLNGNKIPKSKKDRISRKTVKTKNEESIIDIEVTCYKQMFETAPLTPYKVDTMNITPFKSIDNSPPEVIMCYASDISIVIKSDTTLDNKDHFETSSVLCYGVSAPIESGEKNPNPFIPNKVPIDLNDENISRINDLTSNIRRPRGTEKIQGTVFVQFTIMIDGTIRNVRIQKGLHPLLDEEILKALKNMRNWLYPINYETNFDIDYVVPIQILSNEN